MVLFHFLVFLVWASGSTSTQLLGPLLNSSFSSASSPSTDHSSFPTKIIPGLVYFFPSSPHPILSTPSSSSSRTIARAFKLISLVPLLLPNVIFLKCLSQTRKNKNCENRCSVNHHKVITAMQPAPRQSSFFPGISVTAHSLCLKGSHMSDFRHYR